MRAVRTQGWARAVRACERAARGRYRGWGDTRPHPRRLARCVVLGSAGRAFAQPGPPGRNRWPQSTIPWPGRAVRLIDRARSVPNRIRRGASELARSELARSELARSGWHGRAGTVRHRRCGLVGHSLGRLTVPVVAQQLAALDRRPVISGTWRYAPARVRLGPVARRTRPADARLRRGRSAADGRADGNRRRHRDHVPRRASARAVGSNSYVPALKITGDHAAEVVARR
jgi:hypothetical protein